MTRKYSDGTVQSSNLPTSANTYTNTDPKIYRAMVISYQYSDDPKNTTSKSKTSEVIYTVVILGGAAAGQIVSGVRLSRLLTGQFNFHNQTLRKTSKPIATPLEQHDGDIVYIQFVQGKTDFPIIVGYGIGLQDDGKSAIKKADGPSFKWQFNGVFESIDKNGNLTQLLKGGKYDQEKDLFTPAAEGVITTVYDPTKETRTVTYKSGLSVLEDGKNQKLEINAANGKSKVTVDGKANKITLTAGSTFVEIDGASGNIKLSGKNVELGASVTDFVTMFTELCNAFNSHTHMYNPGPGAPAPSQPPMAPLLQTVGSQTVKVQP